ncbi:alkaline phosphatase D family protein [Kaistia dalseonensis]|uniref:Alkaline phosphatase D n=1 Tax=Kaistia dalseonensis TaxID=410840 RepID=A0ABU0H8S2_9HYPH|nr:alkaline phosphatase D family protein [Kaistia dalseonensis]MCX5496105.1 alkaline phosphatase D family protein [Kaistia dalseonensis]MDQ0438710.1 alkaline phosphatase D [Kaistia dalseonensis]
MALRVTENRLSRRRFLQSSAATGLLAVGGSLAMPGISRAADRPVVTHGVQSGDVGFDRAVLWSRTDRPAQAVFEWATTESFKDAHALPTLYAAPDSDYTVKILAEGLPADQEIFYRVRFNNLGDVNAASEPLTGHFRTAPAGLRDVSFVWSGDTVGQGWGINEDAGGMIGYSTMLKHNPDFFIHSGDNVYADGVVKAEVDLPDGTKWKNVVTPEKSKVAETLDEFRGQYKYNFMDKNVRALYANVPVITQWDDHEVTNNWSDSKVLGNAYTEKNIRVLASRAAQAFHEYMPIATTLVEPQRVYRKIAYGPLLDVFMLDMRTYRGPNGDNLEPVEGGVAAFLGAEQLAWLKRELLASKATWKVIAADMPLSLVVWDNFVDNKGKGFEAVSNNNAGVPLGRELEFADLLRFIKAAKIRNTVWLTADVHYTAAHYYDPNKAAFQDFDPFWEFVSGPIHAGTFGPNDLDMTFGPEVKFVKAPPQGQVNLSPASGLQFFGHVAIAADSRVMTVTLRDTADNALWSIDLEPKNA